MDSLKQHAPSYRTGLVLFPDYELLDAYGPWEIFGKVNEYAKKTLLLLESIGTVGTVSTPDGPHVTTDYTLDEAAGQNYDILVLPGGDGVDAIVEDSTALKSLRKLIENATLVLTVCNGAQILAQLGLLTSKPATTNKRGFNDIARKHPEVDWQRNARWVDADKYITSSGVSAGTDMALMVIGRLFGQKLANRVADLIEYQPETSADSDPFSGLQPPQNFTLPDRTMNVIVIIYDNFELFDTFGCMEMVRMANRYKTRSFHVSYIAEEPRNKSAQGPVFLADHTFADHAEIEVLMTEPYMVLVPGGKGTVREMCNPCMLAQLQELHMNAKYVATVCSGSAIVAATGVLDNKPATTNKYSYNILTAFQPAVAWQPVARWCSADKFWSSSGVSAGTDMMLAILAKELGEKAADAIAARAEYVWRKSPEHDPFSKLILPMQGMHWLDTKFKCAAIRLVFGGGLRLGLSVKTSELTWLL
eukprot:TRINITY_DN4268_c0_g1_i1.p1 TRINITY_DN4268_c0_g1~~TRINITY_DN4268_c0_g1_i1.p1  ORF type:complete len:475 (+),score=100.94 TRINITY_DN4268_c0_g1_i1:15-1439(+)